MMELLKLTKIFGKPWYQSMTAWGLVAYMAGEAAVTAACGDTQLLAANACTLLTAGIEGFGQILIVLGIRRKM